MPVKQETATQLKAEIKQLQSETRSLNHQISKFQQAIGVIRVEVGKIVVGRDQVDNLRESIKRIDKVIDNV